MKKILSLIALLALFIPVGLNVQAATVDGTVNISATIASVCGNGVAEDGESCDLGSGNGICPSACSASCTANTCGGTGIPETTYSLSITQVSAAEQCQAGSVSWQAILMPSSTTVASSGYLEYWPTNMPGNVTRTDVTANTTHSVNLSGLSQFNSYSYKIHASYSSYSAEYAGTIYTSCAISSPGFSVLAKNKGVELTVTYPDYNDIAGLIIYNGRTGCPAAANLEYYKSTTSKMAKSLETLIKNATSLNQTYGYTACIYNSKLGYSTGIYREARRAVSEAVDPGATPGDKQIVLSWTNPANESANDFSFSKARLIKVSGACGSATTKDDGIVLSDGTARSFTDAGLTNGQTYNYKLFIQNSYGEYSAGVCLRSVPSAAPIEVPTASCPTEISKTLVENAAQFTWRNPQNQTGVFTLEKIDWQRSDTACAQSLSEGSSVFSGTGQSFSDSGLAYGQSYYYTAFVTYSGNKTANCGCTVVTVPKKVEEPLCENCQLYEISPEFSYFANQGALELIPDSRSYLYSLPSQNFNIRALASTAPKPVKQMTARFNGSDYLLSLDGSNRNYQAIFDLPGQIGKYPLELVTVYTDETYAKKQLNVEILPYGRVISSLGRELPDTDVSIYIYKDGALFAGYGVKNPSKSIARGSYGFMVPDGRYTVVAVKKNYIESRQDIEVKNHIINRNISLTPENIPSAITDIVDNPALEKINRDFFLPLALLVALVNLLTAAPLWSLLNYLQLFFTEPFWFLIGRKRKGWGVVYNSITKAPVDLAVVRLYDAKTKKLIQSRVTDREGRYIFLVNEGQYILEAGNPKFEYPSKIMSNVTEDNKYTDIYHGEMITIKEGSRGIIVANIPMDQKGLHATNDQVMGEYSREKLKRGIALIGPVLAIISFIIMPGWLTVILLAVHLALYFLFRRLALQHRIKSWGVIYDGKGKKPLDKAITRIYSPEYGRMLDYYVTDKYGRYGFLAGHNTYYLTAEKHGFTPRKTDNLDLHGKEGDKVVGYDITLQPGNGEKIAGNGNGRL